MADKKTNPSTLAVPLTTLRELRVRCEAVACSRALSLDDTLKVQAVGRAANRAIPEEVSDDLYALEAREKAIVGEVVAKLQADDLSDDVMNAEYARIVGRSTDIREIQQKAVALWKSKAPFEAKPVRIEAALLKRDDDQQLIMPKLVTVLYRGQTYERDPFADFLALVDDEIIILE